MKKTIEISPQFIARIAGAFYLLTVVTALYAEFFVNARLVVDGDAATTAHNIVTHESLYRSAVVADLIGISCYVAVTALVYSLLKPVNGSVSLLAAFFSLVGCAMWLFFLVVSLSLRCSLS